MYIGIDYGKRRIGVAKSDPLNIIASPLRVVTPRRVGDYDALFTLIDEMCAIEKMEGIVLGYPDEEDERAAVICEQVKRLADALRDRFNVPIFFQDERFSSRAAQELLLQGKKKRKQRKEMLDAAAASVILQDYLDNR